MIDPLTHPCAAPRSWQVAAWVLVGRPIPVYLRPPVTKEFLGQYRVLEDGNEVVEVHPDLRGHQKLLVFLHECAHARLHKEKTRETPAGLAPSSVTLTTEEAKFLKAIGRPIETEADELAQRWYSTAMQVVGEDSTEETCLAYLTKIAYHNFTTLEKP
jgi:hypothetical protein